MDVYRASNSLFLNSKCVFMEYHDILKCPWFVLFCVLLGDKNIHTIFNLTPFKDRSVEQYMGWYFNRKHRNFFKDLIVRASCREFVNDEYCDILLKNYLAENSDLIDIPTSLNMVDVIKKLIEGDIVTKIVVYNEENIPKMKEDVKSLLGDKATFISGDFDKIITSIPIDSTYIFADASKIARMVELNHIDYTSILIPYGYGYNTNEDGSFVVDTEKITQEHCCKINFFDNIHVRGSGTPPKKENNDETTKGESK